MKIIEALKKEKDLLRKFDDLKKKIRLHSAHKSVETPVYPDQKKQVSEWIQACGDILKEIESLRVSIQKTNLATNVAIEFGDGKVVEKSIAAWIHRRRELSKLHASIYECLTDKNIQEGSFTDSNGQKVDVKLVRCYDPATRDTAIELYTSEASTIDSRLEIINAVTELLS